MIKNILFIAAICLTCRAGAQTLSYNERALQYIAQYKEFAEMEQQRVGIPAAVTLGQGILETEAGKSELATIANNHFGIKCKKEWTGETFAHTDDAPNECFRKYPSALHSYKDHSDYLKTSKRYNPCFACSPTDYASWAKALRKCGYATNPRYAQQLIRIIEDFHLQDYTYEAMERKQPVLVASAAAPVAVAAMAEKSSPGEVVPEHDTPSTTIAENAVYGKVTHKNGVKGFYAHKGDVLLEYAIQYKVRYAKLLEINNLPDAPLASDMFIALERGGKVTQILSRDASETTPSANLAAPVAANAVKEEQPVGATIRETVPGTGKEVAAPLVETVPKEIIAEKPVVAVADPIVTAPVPVAAVPLQEAIKPVEKPVNIANEVAVEEMKPEPKAEEPKDQFSRMKARFDKVVYAKPAPKPEPAVTTIREPQTAKQTVITPAAQASVKEFHVVAKGETAFGIAKKYGITMKELMAMNGLNFEAIKVGQKLRVK